MAALKDLTDKLLTEVSSQIATEPKLQPVSPEFLWSSANTQHDAYECIWFLGVRKVRVCICRYSYFSPFAPSNAASTLLAYYRTSRRELMDKGSEKSKTCFILLLWSFLPLEAWLMRPQFL